jgi:putative transposase
MPNSYTVLHIHFVFAVKYREALINNDWKEELHKYITGVFKGTSIRYYRLTACLTIFTYLLA